MRPGEQEVSKEFFTNDVSELLDYLMKEGTEQIGKAPEEMTKEEKKQVISYLDQKGALLITKSGPKICRYLGISKFTLYNYLDILRKSDTDRFCSAKAVFILEEGVMNQPAFFSLMIERRDAVNHGYSVRHGFPVLRERNA